MFNKWCVSKRIACDGYPQSEALYPNVWEYLKSKYPIINDFLNNPRVLATLETLRSVPSVAIIVPGFFFLVLLAILLS